MMNVSLERHSGTESPSARSGISPCIDTGSLVAGRAGKGETGRIGTLITSNSKEILYTEAQLNISKLDPVLREIIRQGNVLATEIVGILQELGRIGLGHIVLRTARVGP